MILDIDMDYFMDDVAIGVGESCNERLSDDIYASSVWSEQKIRNFLENNLGLSKSKKIEGRIVSGHNEALFFWDDLIKEKKLSVPFEVIHVDSHADLGLGYSSWAYILDELLKYPVPERPQYNTYVDCFGKVKREGIGDYLLFGIAYQWISKLTYCANPFGDKNDYVYNILKNYHEELIWDKPVEIVIQLVYNPNMERPDINDTHRIKENYFSKGICDPEVPLTIIPTIEDVNYDGGFDFVAFAQSPNYTPQSADFILDIIKDYIIEC